MSLPTNKRARLQVQFWGHPISAGTGAIDYFVSSRWDWQCDSEHGTPQSHFNEQLVLFEVCKPVLWELLFVTSVLLIRLFRFVSQSLSFAFHRPPGPSMTARDAMRSRLSRLFSVLAAAPASKSPWEEHDLLDSDALGSHSSTNAIDPVVVVVPQAIMKFHPAFDEVLREVLRGYLSTRVPVLVAIVDHGE